VDAVAPPYRGASINSDFIFDFNDQDAADYRLFDVEYVIAPPSATLARGLVPIVSTPKYVLYRAPGGGYAEYAAVARTETASSQLDLFERARASLRGGAATGWQFTRYVYRQSPPAEVPAPIADCPRPGISYTRAQPSRFDVLASCASDSAMVLKVTYHPNWHVTVDGQDVPTFMVSPSYLAFALPAGQHFITAEYRSAPLKDPLFGLGALALVACLAYSWRTLARASFRGLIAGRAPVTAVAALRRVWRWMRERPAVAAVALGGIALAVIWPFTPAIAFNNVDLPTPVPPASARTYALLGKPSRVRVVSRVATAALASTPSVFAAVIASSRLPKQRSMFTVRCLRPLPAALPRARAWVPARARAPRNARDHSQGARS